MKPLVSVVMSVYNGEKHLREAVESILGQTFTDFEFIIVNDGSTDGTRAILESYQDSRIILLHQQNTGLTTALNNGISIARGKYIARQDADDVSRPERIEKQAAFLEIHKDIGLLGCRYECVDELGNVIHRSYLRTENAELQEKLLNTNQFCHGSVMMRKSVLDKVSNYREYFLYAQDHDLWLRMAEISQLSNLADYLYSLRVSSTSISSKHFILQTTYSALAIDQAQKRRLQGRDDLQDGCRPVLPKLHDLPESLVAKVIDYYKMQKDKKPFLSNPWHYILSNLQYYYLKGRLH